MVSQAVRRGAVLFLLGAMACGPLLGLDDLHDRAPPEAPDAADDAGPTCSSSAQCIDEAGSGAPARCVAGKCVPVDLQLCLPQILPSLDRLDDDDVALFAAFIPLGEEAPLATGPSLSYALALKELDQAGGIPGEKRRDVAMLFCASEPDKVEDAVRHVIQDLHVPAIVAAFSTGDITRFVDTYARPAKVFTLNPSVTAETLRYKDVDRLLWNLLGTPEDVALAYRPLVERVERYLRGPSGPFVVDAGAPLEVALLGTGTSLESSVATIIQEGPLIRSGPGAGSRDADAAIVFNGKSPAQNGSNFRFRSVPALEQGQTPDYDAIVDELLADPPHVVIALTRVEIAEIVKRLEARLPEAGAPPPMWLLAPRNANAVVSHVAVDYDEKKKRFLGIQYASAVDPTQKNAWLTRMKAAYPSVDPAKYAASENFYDAVYWLAYGLAAAGPGAPTSGESIRDGVRRMLSGPVIHPGGTDTIADAFRLITLGEVTFEGTLGRPEIDAPTGTWKSVGSAYCYREESGLVGVQYDFLRYNPTTRALDDVPGVSPCLGSF